MRSLVSGAAMRSLEIERVRTGNFDINFTFMIISSDHIDAVIDKAGRFI